MTCDIESQVANLQRSGGAVRARPQSCAHARDQFLRVERLDDVVISATLEAFHDIGRVAFRGQHDDGNPGFLTDPGAHLDAVHPRQHQVEQYEVGFRGVECLDRRSTVGAEGWFEPLRPQDYADHLRQRRVIIDHKNSRVHLYLANA